MSGNSNTPVVPAIPGVSAETLTALAGQGFPPKFIQAFLNTANTLNTAVMTRTPGGAGLGLIERRFDLKGFYIKTKSCDWGPMAGFVCMLPWFNKNGVEAALGNLKYTVNYLKDRPTLKDLRGAAFLPIRIPQSRLAELAAMGSANLVTDKTAMAAANPVGPLLGYAYSEDKTVVMDFMLRPVPPLSSASPVPKPAVPVPEPLWEMNCMNVWIAGGANNQTFTRFNPSDAWFSNAALIAQTDKKGNAIVPTAIAKVFIATALRYPGYLTNLTPEQAQALATQRTALAGAVKGFDQAPNGVYGALYPIMGISNPYPPYSASYPAPAASANLVPSVPPGSPIYTYDDYRNCVSGDYDLMAIWPAVTSQLTKSGSPLPGLVRWTEQQKGIAPSSTAVRPPSTDPNANRSLLTGTVFTPVAGKKFARSLVANPNVIVEFVPDDPDESGEYGNANDAVLTTAQMLNSLVYYFYTMQTANFTQPAVNAAFHSDEGGRPFTKDIGYDVALFLPDHLVGPSNPLAQVITADAAFLAAIMSNKEGCLVPIQAAWLATLMNHATAPDLANLRPSLQALILGPLPQGVQYTALQLQAYTDLLKVFTTAMKPDPKTGAFTETLGTQAVILSTILPAIDALGVDATDAAPEELDLAAIEAEVNAIIASRKPAAAASTSAT